MKKDGRYDVSGLPEAQFEPGSNEQVLRNRLGIKSPTVMDDAETRALEKAMVELVGKYDEKHHFTAADIREIHKRWLGDIYEWPVNIGRLTSARASSRSLRRSEFLT